MQTIQKMFRSATLKLTAWYLAILMAISITFSLVIYQLNYREVSARLENLQHSLIDDLSANTFSQYLLRFENGPGSALFDQSRQAANQMILSLVYINLFVLFAGGMGSYFLAKRTLRPIEYAHEAQSRFTSDASHELRTPLAAMKTEIEVNLRDSKLEVSEARELLESNLEEVNKLIQLTEMLLNLSRLENSKLEVTSIDLVELYQNALKRFPEMNDRFQSTTRKKVKTRANEAAISELIGILIENAIKYSPAESPIHVRILEKHGMAVFEIKNSGDPIPEQNIEHVFDRFFRSDSSRTNGNKNGYGLGLSIAKKIVDVHCSTITVKSNAEATTFTFQLPIIRRTSYAKLSSTPNQS